MTTVARCLAALVLAVVAVLGAPAAPAAHGVLSPAGAEGSARSALTGWTWPTSPVRITAPYVAPAHRYGPGHRGIDLAAPLEADVLAPAAGVIAFSGSVAGRGVVTIDHGAGLVTTLEPVRPAVAIGDRVQRGAVVGSADAGGHTAPGSVHFGVREHGEYINPMLLLGGIPRAVLLPCC